MKLKANLYMTKCGISRTLYNIKILRAGQKTNYDILQTAHRLEKGLCVRNPKPGWGFEKALRLVDLLVKESRQQNPDTKACRIGESVLATYIESKESSDFEEDRSGLDKLKTKVSECGLVTENNGYGGAKLISRDEMTRFKSIEDLFTTRHCIRDFSDTPVAIESIEKAVTLALRAPSACNRQATHIYVISGEDRKNAGSSNDYNADKYLIVTGDMRAFNITELNDWIVSTSIFAGYLTLALHAEGIGACIFRKELNRNSRYNDAIRKICHIPEDEQIILEMAIGNYKDETLVPVSHRREAKEIISIV